jgi:Tol biopolymer transport system component
LLLLALGLPFVGAADVGAASSGAYNIDIVAIDLAGRQVSLTNDPAPDVNPAVARDGRIAFFSGRDTGLYVMDGNGHNVHALSHDGIVFGDDLEWNQASWSPNGRQIAFDSEYLAQGQPCERHCSNWQVLVISSDGSRLRTLTRSARAPAWSPNGSRLAFRDQVDSYFGSSGVGIARLSGSGTVSVPANNGVSSARPVWSTDGRHIAFDSSGWIYTDNADGTVRRRLAAGSDPSWSPDGSRLAFVHACGLFTIDRNGKHRRRISRKDEIVAAAAWSPKHAAIAYIASTKAPHCIGLPSSPRVETVSSDGKQVHVLARETPATLIWGNPVWTADGKRILVAIEAH